MKAQVIIALPKAAWTGADKNKIEALFKSTMKVPDHLGLETWIHTATAVEWWGTIFWTEHLQGNPIKMSDQRITALKNSLSNPDIEVLATDDARKAFKDLGLETPPDID